MRISRQAAVKIFFLLQRRRLLRTLSWHFHALPKQSLVISLHCCEAIVDALLVHAAVVFTPVDSVTMLQCFISACSKIVSRELYELTFFSVK